jgi:hypothetical protein
MLVSVRLIYRFAGVVLSWLVLPARSSASKNAEILLRPDSPSSAITAATVFTDTVQPSAARSWRIRREP